MTQEAKKEFHSIITRFIQKENLTGSEAKQVFITVLNNQTRDMQQEVFLAALTSKDATSREVAGSWEAIYELNTTKVYSLALQDLRTFQILQGR